MSVIPVTNPQTSKVVPLFVLKVTQPLLILYVPPVTLISLSLNKAAALFTTKVPPVLFVKVNSDVETSALPEITKVSKMPDNCEPSPK